jgi:hypothetical protein
MTTIHRIDSYAELVQQIRNDLRLQNPEWIQPNGQSPMCDFYEARLIELLDASILEDSNGKMAAVSGIPFFSNSRNSPAPIFS